MPSTSRRARERANTRERIIEAALHVLETEGAAALTIRRIAADVEYSAPVVYQHFANKEALMRELVDHGYRLMMAGMGPAADEPDIDRRVMRVAIEYVRFAGAHPHLYEVMNGSAVGPEERRRAAASSIAVVNELLTAWSEAHDVTLADLEEACEIVWGTLYGIISVTPDRAERLAEQALSTLLLGWRAGSR